MQHRVLRPSDIKIDRETRLLDGRIEELFVVPRIGEPQVVPARSGPLRHRVCLAFEPHAGRCRFPEPVGGCLGKHRLGSPRRFEVGHLGQQHRQRSLIIRLHQSGSLAIRVEFMPDRKRLTPIPLPREQPVTQAIIHRLAADSRCGQIGGDDPFQFQARSSLILFRGIHRVCRANNGESLFLKHEIHDRGVIQHARKKMPSIQQGFAPTCVSFRTHESLMDVMTWHSNRLRGRRLHNANLRDGVLLGKFKIAFVMRRHGHDRARAVADQDIVGDPNRNPLGVDRIDCVATCKHTALIFGEVSPVEVTLQRCLLTISLYGVSLLGRRQPIDAGVFRREDHVRCSEQRVRTSRIDTNDVVRRLSWKAGGCATGFPSVIE